MNVVMHARKSLLFSNKSEWIRRKKNDESHGDLFDVTMGCYDGAEVCETVGLFLLNEIRVKFGSADIGLYRDDGDDLLYFLTYPDRNQRESRRNL